MSRTQDTAFPIQRADGFCTHPTQDDYELAQDKARELLRSILPESSLTKFEETGVVWVSGKRGTYLISPCTQTEIHDLKTGRCVAYACLQLTIPAPDYDRMVAEYLLIKNAEDVYWKKANIFSHIGNELRISTLVLVLILVAVSIALFENLLLDVISYLAK